MGSLINGQYVPGPNDHHVVVVDGQVTLESGLGKDEPDKLTAQKAAARGDAKVAALHKQLEERGVELVATKRQLEIQQRSAEEREAALAAKEQELAAREALAREEREKAELAKMEAADALAALEKAKQEATAEPAKPPAGGRGRS